MKLGFILAPAALCILSLTGCSHQSVEVSGPGPQAIADGPPTFKKVDVDGITVNLAETRFTDGDTKVTCRQYVDSIKWNRDLPVPEAWIKMGRTCIRNG